MEQISKRYIVYLGLLLTGLAMLSPAQEDTEGRALLLNLRDAIGPASSDYIHRGLARAAAERARIVILQLDTPGGLDTAMRDIIRDIIASPVPVAVFVAPSGARAASAGTYMLYAAHIAAMAPGTNLGAATPVQIGGMPGTEPPKPPRAGEPEAKKQDGKSGDAQKDQGGEAEPDAAPADSTDAMSKKMVNDAVAYIRSLAELRGRNADWAERAVREAASLSAESALQQRVIEFIAEDAHELLRMINGRVVNVQGRDITLDTAGLQTESLEPDWRNRLLAVITNPNIAYILMLLGVYGLFFELANPGYVLPGVIGAISLLLALYAFQVLPVNYAGLALIAVGIAFMIAELFVPSFGALGIGGIVAFVIGSIILFDQAGGGLAISLPLIIAVAVLTAVFFLVALRTVLAAHRRPVVSGAEELVGAVGEALEDFDGPGSIHVHGENWQARSRTPVRRGAKIRVTSRDGLVLWVELAEEGKP